MLEIAGEIADAIGAHVERLGIPRHGHGVEFASRLGAPVFHVAVQGPVADGRNRMFFHADQFMVGADIARVAHANVYAYFAGPEAEAVRCFDANGERLADISTLAALATRLGVVPGLHTDSPVVLALDGEDFEVVVRYCEELLAGETDALYIPGAVTREVVALAARFQLRPGEVFAAAWETAKARMHATIPLAYFEGDPMHFTVAPPRAGHALVVPESAPDLPELVIDLPAQTVREMRDFATSREMDLTLALLAAYVLARSRLHVATRS